MLYICYKTIKQMVSVAVLLLRLFCIDQNSLCIFREYQSKILGRVAQSVTCLATDA